MSESTSLAKLFRPFMLVVVCLGIGAVGGIVIVFFSGFLFAGPDGDKWVVWFFGNNGSPFFALALVIAAFAYLWLAKAKLRLFF